jgi:exopolyphosphatase/guanosine-5'-triphosphate,3'-diphosphate pyrophosphatase
VADAENDPVSMTVYVVRHAIAVRRSDWHGPERLRPLTGGGHRQARRLAERLAHAEPNRVISSPHLRCRQTVEPLVAERGLRLETDERLSEGASLSGALALLSALGEDDALLCSHGDLIPDLIGHLSGFGLRVDGELSCEKASVWVLEGPPGTPDAAFYLPPPPKHRQRDLDSPPPAEESEENEAEPEAKLRVAVLDLGSTSFHLMVADATPTGGIRRVLRERTMLRLGAALASRDRIPGKVARRAVEVASALARHAEHADAAQLLLVATAALRDARNGADLAARIGDAVGEPVRILSGEEEARLIFAAVRHRVALPPGRHLGLDLGGGSLELAVGDAFDVEWGTTLPLGVARLHGELGGSGPLGAKQERALRERVRQRLTRPAREVARRAPGDCVATGGTVSALARRIAARRSRWQTRAVGQVFVPRAELAELAEELAASTLEERLAMPGLSRSRADLLPVGAIILHEATLRLGVEGLTVSDWGLREGVILEALGLVEAAPARKPETRAAGRRRA